ncbi:hypothetical protein N7492_007593 [Penicillium capsulatum]|uniref:WSC domain-containing protein n=1 Tax=Penicillium capsulatum TaxID=69766 RepID=A0A9W9I2J6_9EURO|nr:hypothetical protein N7492_007593 [Penicillium capsulatum]KAJ6117428.1 hypothetical protein N7512_007153 [Penicillium capsulatum]
MHFHLAALLALPVLGLASKYGSQNLGCYSENNNVTSVLSFHFQSHGYCINHCNGLKSPYAALRNGIRCECTVTIDESSKVDDDQCNTACSGWPEDKCGGRNAYTLLTTGISPEDSFYKSPSKSSDSDSDSDSDSTVSISSVTETVSDAPSASTVGGGILVVAHPSSMRSSMATSASASTSANANAASVTKASGAASVTAASSSASSASPTTSDNAAGTLRAGPVAGIMLAGLGLLL